MSQQHIVCYVPVLHAGYLEFFDQHPGAHIHVVGTSVLQKYLGYARKDVRALSPDTVVKLLNASSYNADVLEVTDLETILRDNAPTMPDDDLSRVLVEAFNLQNATLEPVFLRWDRKAVDVNEDVQPDRTIELPADDAVLKALYEEANKSTNWWRNVAAAVIENGKVQAISHNSSLPTEYSSAIDGDPRITANRGTSIDTSIDIHAEAQLIGGAARRGEKLNGVSLYVSTFPCPTCAKLIAASGIKHCYFVEGYASIDGQSILKANGVEIIKVDTDARPFTLRQRAKKYPEK